MLNFYDLKEWAKKRGKDSASVCTDEKLQFWAELLVQDMAIRTGGAWLYDEYTFSSTASTGEYPFPSRYWKSIRLYDTTNEKPIERKHTKVEDGNIDRSNSTPWAYTPAYTCGVAAQPETAGKVTIVSSDTDDTSTNGDVFILKGRYGNVEYGESINMNGTTGVDSTNDYTQIWSAVKGGTRSSDNSSRYTTDGTYTLTDSDGNTLLSLTPEEDELNYQWIRLINTPDDTISYRLHFLRKVKRMYRNHDTLDVPYGFDNAALLGFEWYVKWYLYDQKDMEVFKLYLDELQRAYDFWGGHSDERVIHGEIDSMRGGLYQPPAGVIDRRA